MAKLFSGWSPPWLQQKKALKRNPAWNFEHVNERHKIAHVWILGFKKRSVSNTYKSIVLRSFSCDDYLTCSVVAAGNSSFPVAAAEAAPPPPPPPPPEETGLDFIQCTSPVRCRRQTIMGPSWDPWVLGYSQEEKRSLLRKLYSVCKSNA